MSNLTSLVLEINNEVQAYVPNTLKFKNGDGEKQVFTESNGDGTVSITTADNDETKIGNVTFELFNRPENAEKVRLWSQSVDGVAIKLSRPGFSRSFKTMVMTTDPEIPVSPDGRIACEFQGSQAV